MRTIAAVALVSMLLATDASAICALGAQQLEEYQASSRRVQALKDPNELLGTDVAGMSIYAGYVMGTFDTFQEAGLLCVPSGWTLKRIQKLIESHWEQTMGMLGTSPADTCALDVIGPILVGRFPCGELPADETPAQ